jgi:hypothetical protein
MTNKADFSWNIIYFKFIVICIRSKTSNWQQNYFFVNMNRVQKRPTVIMQINLIEFSFHFLVKSPWNHLHGCGKIKSVFMMKALLSKQLLGISVFSPSGVLISNAKGIAGKLQSSWSDLIQSYVEILLDLSCEILHKCIH